MNNLSAPGVGLTLILAVTFWPVTAATRLRGETTGVLSALPEEMELLTTHLKNKRVHKYLGVEFYTGTIHERKVVLATSGIGKVNAAKTVTLLLDHFSPSEVIFSGVAGGLNPDLAPGDIVVGTRTAQHDFGKITDDGFEIQTPTPDTPIFIEPPPELLRLTRKAAQDVGLQQIATTQGKRVPVVVHGVIITGDVFVASPVKVAELRRTFNADAVEMEGAAVALVCWQQRVPCVVIRSISDKADATAWEDFERFIKAAAENSARFTLQLLKAIGEQSQSTTATHPKPGKGSTRLIYR